MRPICKIYKFRDIVWWLCRRPSKFLNDATSNIYELKFDEFKVYYTRLSLIVILLWSLLVRLDVSVEVKT